MSSQLFLYIYGIFRYNELISNLPAYMAFKAAHEIVKNHEKCF